MNWPDISLNEFFQEIFTWQEIIQFCLVLELKNVREVFETNLFSYESLSLCLLFYMIFTKMDVNRIFWRLHRSRGADHPYASSNAVTCRIDCITTRQKTSKLPILFPNTVHMILSWNCLYEFIDSSMSGKIWPRNTVAVNEPA